MAEFLFIVENWCRNFLLIFQKNEFDFLTFVLKTEYRYLKIRDFPIDTKSRLLFGTKQMSQSG
jgi:hypothetical protein